MLRAVGLFIALAAALSVSTGCGDGSPKLSSDDLVAKLRAAGFTVEDGVVPPGRVLPDGVHYYLLHFTQPVDHHDATQGTFTQRISLLHSDERAPAPLIVYTTGYADAWGYSPTEPMLLLQGNQVSIEHRFYGESKPAPLDWSKLTVEQMADDEHDVITALRGVYQGAFVSSGGSKGGVTALAHRRFFPSDVEGTVLYSAPLSHGDDGGGDEQYHVNLETIGPAPCRDALHAVTLELFARRDELATLAGQQTGHTYSRVLIGPALESAITSLDWSFWQSAGADKCNTVPVAPTTMATADLFMFLQSYAKVSEYDDLTVGMFEAYYYQTYAQLGYPEGVESFIDPALLRYRDPDYRNALPLEVPVPTYDPTVMDEVDRFVQHGDGLMFLYGQWDPWAARRFSLASDATHAVIYEVARGNHGVQIQSLAGADHEDAWARLEAFTGVAPSTDWLPRAKEAAPDPAEQLPPPISLALRAAQK